MAKAANATNEYIDGIWGGASALQFLEDGDEDALLKRAGNRLMHLLSANFSIAMMRVAEGDCEGALDHFETCLELGLMGTYDFELAEAYLHQAGISCRFRWCHDKQRSRCCWQ